MTAAYKLVRQSIAALSLGAFVLSAAAAQPATYKDLKPGEFMKRWYLLEPIPVFTGKPDAKDQESQRKAFKENQVPPDAIQPGFHALPVTIGGKKYAWKAVEAHANSVDLRKLCPDTSFAIAYLCAEIDMSEDRRALLGIGSDDGVKIWLNGALIHENWVGRPVREDDDVAKAHFRKGSNCLLVKIQNMEYDWGFALRILGPEQIGDQLAASASKGDLDAVRLLLDNDADVNGKNSLGLTALQVAKIRGRAEVAQVLLDRGGNASEPTPPPEVIVDKMMNSRVKQDWPGVAILAARDGKILFAKGYGLANVEKKTPVTVDTKFRIGSITKQFIAAAILKLQEMGRLKISDALAKFIPDFPRGNEVTLQHLLTHTSGIHSYTSEPDFLGKVSKPIEPESLIASIKRSAYDFSPGERYLYNNSGYILLDYIIEKVSGQQYGDFLRQHFLAPLDMTATGVYRNAVPPELEATGYSYATGKVELARDWDMSWAGGAGSLYSTVGDLFKWNEGLFAGRVLKDASFQEAVRPARLSNGSEAEAAGFRYGYGVGIMKQRGLEKISHGGGLDGFVTMLSRYPAYNFTVVVLVNSAPPVPELEPSSLADQIAEYYLWQSMQNQQSFSTKDSVDPKLYDDYLGRYEYPQGAILTVSKEDGRFFAQLSGQPTAEIFPRSQNEFYWKVVDAQVTFIRDDKGVVTHAIHHQGGAELKAPKIKEEQPASVDPAVYDAYLGEYELGPNIIITVSKESNGLFLQVTGQSKNQIFPRSETEYFFTIVKADVAFQRDPAGKVSGLVLKQGGITQPAKKIK